MKKVFLILILTLFNTLKCRAQLNNLSEVELFESISFNGASLGFIMESRGDVSKLKKFFGNDLEEVKNNSAPFLAKDLFNNNISLGFEDETDSGSYFDLTHIFVLDPSITVIINKLSVNIGDEKSKFSDYAFNTKYNGYVFTDKDTGSISLAFKIDNVSGKVSFIEFNTFD